MGELVFSWRSDGGYIERETSTITPIMKTQDKQVALQEARKAAELMERLVLQYKDEPNWLELVADEYKKEAGK